MDGVGVGLVALLLATAAVRADQTQPTLHGIALGMTPAQASDAAHLPCETPQYSSDLSCKDTGDGSTYHAMFSAGDPSIALSVEHDFCSRDPAESVLKAALQHFGAPADRVRGDPNGATVELDGDNEAVLNADGGTCPDGGKHFVLLIRSNGLIKMSSEKAVQRAKNALH